MSALKDLVTGGASCAAGAGGGPASDLVRHLTRDPTLAGRLGPSQQVIEPRRPGPAVSAARNAFAAQQAAPPYSWESEFASSAWDPSAVHGELPTPQTKFGFGSLRHEVDEVERSLPPFPSRGDPRGWAAEFTGRPPDVTDSEGQERWFKAAFERAFENAGTSHCEDLSVEQLEHFTQEGPVLSKEDQQRFGKAYADTASDAVWNREFTKYESWAHEFIEQGPPEEMEDRRAISAAAGLLLDSVDMENSKFTNSQFFGLMRKLRDGDVAIEGDRVVEQVRPFAGGNPLVMESNKRAIPPEAPTNAIPLSAQSTGADGPTWATGFEDRIDAYLKRAYPHGRADADSALAAGGVFTTAVAADMESSWSEDLISV